MGIKDIATNANDSDLLSELKPDLQSDIDALGQKLKKILVGPNSIIRYLHRVAQNPGGLRIVNYTCVLNSTKLLFGADIPGATGAAGLDKKNALIAALGEAVERYAAAAIPWEDLLFSDKLSLDNTAIGLDQFGMYLPEQYDEDFPLAQWTPESKIYWVKGVNLINNEPRLIPAPLIYIPYLYRDKESRTDFVSLGVSSGAACHTDERLVRLNGIYEVVERDAFMITWMRKMTRARIIWQNDKSLSDLFDKHYANCGVIFHLFDLTLDIGLPTILCLAESNLKPGRVCSVGCATRSNYREACEKAMLEAAQCTTWAHYLIDSYPDWKPESDFSNIQSFQEHVMLYLQTGMIDHLSFLLDTPLSMELPESTCHSIDESYEFALKEVAKNDIEVIEVKLTTNEIAELDLIVVKMILPGLVQINGDHRHLVLANTRFDSVPTKLGLDDLCAEHRNPMPHPFP